MYFFSSRLDNDNHFAADPGEQTITATRCGDASYSLFIYYIWRAHDCNCCWIGYSINLQSVICIGVLVLQLDLSFQL